MISVLDSGPLARLKRWMLSSPRFQRVATRRVQLLTLLSISSGIPLGWVYLTFGVYLKRHGVDKATIGLLSGVSLPWTIKFLWSPLIDRYAFRWPGRRRSWMILAQLALAATFVAWAVFAWRHEGGTIPREALWAVAGLGATLAFFSATQDIALDAYAVEVLHPDEREPASGLRTFWYRIGMLLAGGVLISMAGVAPWWLLFLACGALFVGFVFLTLASPEPEVAVTPPRSLATAVVEPIRQYFRRPDAIAVGLFLVFYKFGDNMGGTMVNLFLTDLCFSNPEIGLLVKTLGTVATITGSLVGVGVMLWLGLGRSLWAFGVLQAAANLLYSGAALSRHAPMVMEQCPSLPALGWVTRAWIYGSVGGEYFAQGLATAAQGVLLLRVCDKRYSATQFALLSSLFALGRWASGLPSGWLAEKLGYPVFFAACATIFALPGFLFLQRIAPFGHREVRTADAAPDPGPST